MSNDDTMMIFQFFGLLYSAFTLSRLIQYVMKDAGLGEFGKYAWVFAIFGIIALLGSAGESGFYVMMGSLFFVTYLTSTMVIFEGGQAAGAMFNKGFFQAIPAVILVLATVSVGFLEPLIGAPLYAGVLGLNILLEYQDTYGLMNKEFMSDQLTRYIFVWPPLVLLLVLADVFVLSNLIGSFGATTITTVLTLVGFGFGYYRTKKPKTSINRPKAPTPYVNFFPNLNTQDRKSVFPSLDFNTCPECKKPIFQPSDHGIFCSQNPFMQDMKRKTCAECNKVINEPSDHGIFCSQNPFMQDMKRKTCSECNKVINEPSDHGLFCSKNPFMQEIKRNTCLECKKVIYKPSDHAFNCSKFRLF